MTTPYSRRRDRRRLFLVRVGVYFAVLGGVLCQWAVQRFDARELTLDLRISGLSVSRVVVACLVAVMVYRQIDGKGELDGRTKHVDRALVLGFTSGFTLMGIANIGEGA